MELKLNVYGDRFCRKVEKTLTAEAFELSTGMCEDVLDIVKIDLFGGGGLAALSTESQSEIVIGIVKDGLPYFKDLMAELFEVPTEELRNTKVTEIADVIVQIIKYSFTQLSSLGGKNSKN